MISNVTLVLSIGHPVKTYMNLFFVFCNLEMTLDKLVLNNTFILVVIGDLNRKSKNYITETVTYHFDLHQFIHDPTHTFKKSSSYKDLIFTSQPNKLSCPFFLSHKLPPPNCIWET